MLSSYDRLVTGRYHAVCFALLLRLPFHAMASNTRTIEATIEDVGLHKDRILAPGSKVPPPLNFSPNERAAISDFIARTRDAATKMVSIITH